MIKSDWSKPLIVQSDLSLILDVYSETFDSVRDEISLFSELEKSLEHIHTYKISQLSLWNAASVKIGYKKIIDTLNRYSRFPLQDSVHFFIKNTLQKFGSVMLKKCDDPKLLQVEIIKDDIKLELLHNKKVSKFFIIKDGIIYVKLIDRGIFKQELINIGYPVADLAPLIEGDRLDIKLKEKTLSGKEFVVRDYQNEAVEAFYGGGKPGSGFGTVVLACGSGKTVVGMAAMQKLGYITLILTTNIVAVHQWINELLDKTTLTKDDIGEYSGMKKEIKAVTVATYQILTWREKNSENFPHFSLFSAQKWGLIIYDEVHLLPAPIFRITAEIQAVRRLGLTATLIREDGKEKEVFSLVGPKRYDVPWKDLEKKGWIASAYCVEYRVELNDDLKLRYAIATKREKYRIASENPEKLEIVKDLLAKHKGESILIIGQYIDQLQKIAEAIDAPIIMGSTPTVKREELYSKFKSGEIKSIVVSKVANFAIDLPDASVAIQVSGTFGSRQEEAQRLGRILRPKKRQAIFYSLVSSDTSDEHFSVNRQKFLIEQGYEYRIMVWE